MSFIGWIELYDTAYIVNERGENFQVDQYKYGSKVMDSNQVLSAIEFKQFVDELDIDPTLLPQGLRDAVG